MVFKNHLTTNKFVRLEEPEQLDLPDNNVPNLFCKNLCTICLLLVFPLLSLSVLILGRLMCYNANEIGYIDYVDLFKRNTIIELWENNFGPFLADYYFEKRDPLPHYDFPHFHMPNPPVPGPERCDKIEDVDKVDCLPRFIVILEGDCHARGCCYHEGSPEVPFCYYPRDYNSYKYVSINKTERSVVATLQQQFKSPYPKDLPKLVLSAEFLSEESLLIKITDEKDSRYRVPFPELPTPSKKFDNPLYDFILDMNSTGFKVVRKNTNTTIFDSQNFGGFIFSDQLIQISGKIPSHDIFGIGESRHGFKVPTDWRSIALHNHDRIPTDYVNGYGSHPVYMGLEPGGLAHGVFVLSSHSMDIILQPSPAVTYRLIGGPLILGFVLGPSPLEVNTQYVNLIGKPYLPPYWALGFHLCRFGYNSLDEMKKVWNQTRAAGIPYDTQWTDLDYMKNQNDFTLSDAFQDLSEFVDELHHIGMHYVILIDPGVSGSEPKGTYPPLDIGLEKGIFIKDSKGKEPLYGKVWNFNSTVFPDFTHPQTVPYWVQMIEDFHKKVKFDGAWIDMNELSNMVDGSLTGCPSNQFEDPPYVPSVDGKKLNYKTICMSAKHHDVEHYAVHNVHASLEAVVTNFAMVNARDGKRALVISRASSPGLGAYSGHWTGDVFSTWDDMAQSISDMFSFSLFGIPLVGADICGFNKDTTKNLCSRWTQLGAFYPFSRNHNGKSESPQDPVSLGLERVASQALYQRYMLLPYLYTLFYEANTKGTPVVRPTFYIAPEDVNTYELEDQFFWGDGLLIAPVLKEGLTFVTPYLPKGRWYFTGDGVETLIESIGQKVSAPAPDGGKIPTIFRGGKIIPGQIPGQTTTQSRMNSYVLLVFLDSLNAASGSLFVDDGETLEGNFNLLSFETKNNTLQSTVESWTYDQDLLLRNVTIYGNHPTLKSVKINGQDLNFSLLSPIVLSIGPIDWNMKNGFTLQWN